VTLTATATVTTVLDHLVEALRRAGTYNRNDQSPPVVVLWTDEQCAWESVVPLLRRRLPILTVGEYALDEQTGPAIWIRCALAGEIPEVVFDLEIPPVLYLPSVSRLHLRAVEECSLALQPIAELQFRGKWFTQDSGRDWSPHAFLVNVERGLGLDVASDADTAAALRTVLARLVDEPVSRLAALAPLNAAALHTLAEGDIHGSMLRWMDDPDEFRAMHPDWASFRELSRQQLDFDPEADTPIGAGERLAAGKGEWERVWRRFCEAPSNYANVPTCLRAAPRADLFASAQSEKRPQDNEAAEAELRSALVALDSQTDAHVRAELGALDAQHGMRRGWVWAKLDQTPLANALEHLRVLADVTVTALQGSSTADLIAAYAVSGWRADDAVLRALGVVERAEDLAAVQGPVSALYRPWAEAGVNAFVSRVTADGVTAPPASRSVPAGTCLLFTDGLRYDLGCRLADEVRRRRLNVEVRAELSAVPTITATAKPGVSPVAGLFAAGDRLGTRVAESGTAVTAEVLRRTLRDEGFQTLASDDTGDPSGRGWTELGDIDALGHSQGVKLARYVDRELQPIADRVTSLVKAGWSRVEVVTDHGWLLGAGELTKIDPDLPTALTDVRKGRCALVKDDAIVDLPTLPWTWDPLVTIAVAPGLTAFERGKVYEHGGVSPQESIVPHLVVTSGEATLGSVVIDQTHWTGLRCRVRVQGAPVHAVVDLRSRPADPSSSLAAEIKELDGNGEAALLPSSDDLEGAAAVLVVLAADGTVLAQKATVIGGGS
jgi:hypothetical protein